MLNETKKTFLLGFTSALAIIFFAGFLIMTAAYFQKGKELDKKQDSEKVALDNTVKTVTAPKQEKVNITLDKNDRIYGDKNAPVTIVEYSDLQCPYCARFNTTMNQIMRDYKGKVRWVYRHFPLASIHPFAKNAALAAECAGEQGKFFEYTNNIFENQSELNDDYLKQAASTLNLDADKFNKCLTDQKYLDKVNKDAESGRSFGVSGTPTSFINGQLLGGAMPYDQVKAEIEKLIK